VNAYQTYRMGTAPLEVLVVIGTRPEAIKLAPVVLALGANPATRPFVVTTGQHQEILYRELDFFGVAVDTDLAIFHAGASLNDICATALRALDRVLASAAPDCVAVQGDTTTAFAGAFAAFNRRLPVVHVEAGLRTADPHEPFPEEMNRRLVSRIADLHLAPTRRARDALLGENVDPGTVFLTGNTGIDALEHAVDAPVPVGVDVVSRRPGRRLLLVTAHRRENWGEPMRRIGSAVARLARSVADLDVVLSLHPNPAVREALVPQLEGLTNVSLVEPVAYVAFAHLLQAADVVLTDSGGIQEEAPALGKPVFVMRAETERPEAVECGAAELVGCDPDRIVSAVTRVLEDSAAYAAMVPGVSPYGDGHAARRTVEAILHRFRGAAAPDELELPTTSHRDVPNRNGERATAR